MPVVRVATAACGLVLLGGSLAGAAEAEPSASAPTDDGPAVAIDARIVGAGDDLFLTGGVTGSERDVVLYRATRCEQLATGAVDCDFERAGRVEQTRGTYRFRLEVPKRPGLDNALFWQARVAGAHADADTEVWRTYRLD